MSPQQQLLQDEARAWREIAGWLEREAAADSWLNFECASIARRIGGELLRERMQRRIHCYLDQAPVQSHAYMSDGNDRIGPAIMGVTWLALEAEDELKALTPVSRPSSLRRPRQHKRGK